MFRGLPSGQDDSLDAMRYALRPQTIHDVMTFSNTGGRSFMGEPLPPNVTDIRMDYDPCSSPRLEVGLTFNHLEEFANWLRALNNQPPIPIIAPPRATLELPWCYSSMPTIKRVIYPDGKGEGMTIVLWKDGTKTIVRCQEGDTFDPYVGLLACVAKKAYGNKSKFNDVLRPWEVTEEE